MADQCLEDLFHEFKKQAANVSCEVFRAKTAADIFSLLATLLAESNAKKVIIAKNAFLEAINICTIVKRYGADVYTDVADIAEHADTSDIGISGALFGIAATGSICLDATAIETRLVSMLPPVHVAILKSNDIVPGIQEALAMISQPHTRSYMSFITGPSRTADIERVLTIGVHGPSRLVIIVVDEVSDRNGAGADKKT